jgi:uncharacterized protein
MGEPVARIRGLFRYPVKSMAGVPLPSAALGWHGIEGDRRLAFRRLAEKGGFPWLSASRLARLVLYRPFGGEGSDPELPTHVKTPDGRELELAGDELRAELAAALGADLELMHLSRGIFDEAPVSIVSVASMEAVAGDAQEPADVRRFRPNLLVEVEDGVAFAEDAWIGKVLRLGPGPDAPAVAVTMRDQRCVMINLDPDTAAAESHMMKSAVRLNGNNVGVYAAVVRTGTVVTGAGLYLEG